MSDDKKLGTIRETLNHIATKEEFVEFKDEILRATTKLVEFVKQIKQKNVDSLVTVKDEMAARNKEALSQSLQELEMLKADLKERIANIKDGVDGLNGIDGLDADEDKIMKKLLKKVPKELKPKDIRNLLEKLKGRERLRMSSIRGIKEEIKKLKKKIKEPGLGTTSVIGHYKSLDQSMLTASGTIDGSNVTFGFAIKPVILCVNGAFYREGKGWSWDAANSEVTIDGPVGTGGDIYALT